MSKLAKDVSIGVLFVVTWALLTATAVWQFAGVSSLFPLYVLLPVPICGHLVHAKMQLKKGLRLFGLPWKAAVIILTLTVAGALHILFGLTAKGWIFEGAAASMLGHGIFFLSYGVLSMVFWFMFLNKLPSHTLSYPIKGSTKMPEYSWPEAPKPPKWKAPELPLW